MDIETIQKANLAVIPDVVNRDKKIIQNLQDTTTNNEKEAILSESYLEELIDTLERGIKQFSRRFKFTVNKELNRVIVKVIDKDTEKVIREIPPSEIQNLTIKIREAIGLLFDTKI